MNLQLRKCRNEDINLLFQWANDAQVRSNAFNQEPILWEAHEKWFGSRINSDRCRIFILELDHEPAGQIRFDKDAQGELVIDYSIDQRQRGKGLGREIVALGLKELSDWAHRVKALVKQTNTASIRVFESLGFSKNESKESTGYIEFKIEI